MSARRQQAGFTLIEAAVAALVLTIFLAGALGMIVNNNKIARQTQSKLNATQAVRAGLDRLNPLLRRADTLLVNAASIPPSDIAAVGSGFFPATLATSNSAVFLRIPVFDRVSGAMSSQNSYACLYVADNKLMVTYAIFNPDGTLNYKRRDEVLVANAQTPTDTAGNAQPIFTYWDAGGSMVSLLSSQAQLNGVVRIHLALAARDTNVNSPTSQVNTDIRLANQSTRRSTEFVAYNPYGSTMSLQAIDITGPSTAILTRVDFGSTAVWSGSQTLSGTEVRLSLASPYPTLTSRAAINSTLWFAPVGSFSGTYSVKYVTTTGQSLATTFTQQAM